MADYVVVSQTFEDGRVIGMFPRTASDNAATAIADGHLTVDGVIQLDGIPADCTDMAFTLMTDPAQVIDGVVLNALGLDDPAGPGETVALSTPGGRNPVEYNDVDEFGLMLDV